MMKLQAGCRHACVWRIPSLRLKGLQDGWALSLQLMSPQVDLVFCADWNVILSVKIIRANKLPFLFLSRVAIAYVQCDTAVAIPSVCMTVCLFVQHAMLRVGENLCPRSRRCAGGGRRGVINNFGDSHTLMITVTVQSTSTRLVVWKSVYDTHVYLYMWHGTSHAGCAVVEFTRTMRVLNHAGSGIERGNCLKCSSDWHAICMRNS